MSHPKAKKRKRALELVVLSDIHLGTYGCKAKELLNYLKSVKPDTLVLNGDIIDIWQFSKRYFPKSHLKIIKYLATLLSKGTKIFYITGNHDEMFRKFDGVELGNLKIQNKLVLKLDGKKAWFFHGDVFDVTMKYSKWLARLGGKGYDLLIIINLLVNRVSKMLGFGKISLSKRIKDSVKSAVKYVVDYEKTAAEIAMKNGFDFVVCGHIHQPNIQLVMNKGQSVTYLNSGDWVENLSALEYNHGKWKIYKYYDDPRMQVSNQTVEEFDLSMMAIEETHKEIFGKMVREFNVLDNN